MRLLMVSTSYPVDAADWRGGFIRNLVFAMARQPDVELRLWAPPGELPHNVTSAVTGRDAHWLGKLMQAGGIAHLMRRGGLSAAVAPIRLLAALSRAYRHNSDVDAYLVHWLQCAIPLPADGKPLVLTALGNDLKLLKLPFVKSLVRRALRGRPCVICPNASWMEAPLKEAFGDLAQVTTVGFGVDPVWSAVQRTPSPGSPDLWLAVTRLTRDKLGPLFEWSAAPFSDGTRELHLFGPMQEQVDLPPWVHYHGVATAESLAGTWFPRACGLVSLSAHAEGRPQVMLEAMTAGLPIVASAIPAHADLIRSGVTGELCTSETEYAAALARLGDPQVNASCGRAAREAMRLDAGTWDDCAARFRALLLAMKARPE